MYYCLAAIWRGELVMTHQFVGENWLSIFHDEVIFSTPKGGILDWMGAGWSRRWSGRWGSRWVSVHHSCWCRVTALFATIGYSGDPTNAADEDTNNRDEDVGGFEVAWS